MTTHDHLIELLPERLWHSGCEARFDAVLRARIDTIIAVGDGEQRWLREWKGHCLAKVRPHERPEQAFTLHAPLIDTHRPGLLDLGTVRVVVDTIISLLRHDRRVLVHCDGGRYRSVLVNTLVLARIERLDGPVALARVQRLRGYTGDKPCGVPSFDALIQAVRA